MRFVGSFAGGPLPSVGPAAPDLFSLNGPAPDTGDGLLSLSRIRGTSMSVKKSPGASQENAAAPAYRTAAAPPGDDAAPRACAGTAVPSTAACGARPTLRSPGVVRATRGPLVRAPQLPQAAARQNIASYAHLHGVVLTRGHTPVGTLEPATLCRILREAIEATTEGRRERAETVVRSIAARIGQAGGEPLPVPQVALDVLRRLSLAARLATAAPGLSIAAPVGGGRPTMAARRSRYQVDVAGARAADDSGSRSWS
jgi:hypothetical protein